MFFTMAVSSDLVDKSRVGISDISTSQSDGVVFNLWLLVALFVNVTPIDSLGVKHTVFYAARSAVNLLIFVYFSYNDLTIKNRDIKVTGLQHTNFHFKNVFWL